MLQTVAQTDPVKQLCGDGLGIAAARQFQGEHDVFQRVHLRQQLKRLKDEAEMSRPPRCTLFLVERAKSFTEEGDIARAGCIKAAKEPQEG